MKICIVGGGTAGWIAAYFLVNDHANEHKITVIESSKIGIIGAGEGSTGTMVELLNGTYFNKSVDIEDFLQKTNGTKKQGIYHNNWTGDGTGYFAPIDTSPTWYHFEDTYFKFVLGHLGKEKLHMSSPIGIDYEYKRNEAASAFHFDGHKVGEYFKGHCIKSGITLIDAVVNDAICDSKGNIKDVMLDSGDRVEADFFIDCTGFSKILAEKVGIKWKSYSEYLPMNSAIPFQLKHNECETIKTYTSAHALSSGWMWEIPLQDRKGCGYVYDDNFISQDQAVEELETVLGREIEPIKHIKFDSGRSDAFWKKNVLVLGLSAAFVEPLEATSIHSTIIQLLIFSKEFLFKSFSDTNKDSSRREYNEKISILYDSILDFISFHYQGKRNDSEFWKWIQNDKIVSPRADHFYKKSKLKIPGFLEIHGIIGSPNVGLWNWVSAGIDVITEDQARREIASTANENSIRQQYEQFLNGQVSQKSYIKYT